MRKRTGKSSMGKIINAQYDKTDPLNCISNSACSASGFVILS